VRVYGLHAMSMKHVIDRRITRVRRTSRQFGSSRLKRRNSPPNWRKLKSSRDRLRIRSSRSASFVRKRCDWINVSVLFLPNAIASDKASIPWDRFPRNILVTSLVDPLRQKRLVMDILLRMFTTSWARWRGSLRECHKDAMRKTGFVEFQL